MAKDQNTAILQSIVAELRQLNKASKKDMIREQEALERQEKACAVTEEQVILQAKCYLMVRTFNEGS